MHPAELDLLPTTPLRGWKCHLSSRTWAFVKHYADFFNYILILDKPLVPYGFFNPWLSSIS